MMVKYCADLKGDAVSYNYILAVAKNFAYQGINSVVIPDTVTRVEAAAFYSNNLTSVKLPSKLVYIGRDAFIGNKLTSISIPSTVTTISSMSFNENQLPQDQAYIYKRNRRVRVYFVRTKKLLFLF